MTLSEELFDKYLMTRKIKYDVEQGEKVHPDRFLHFPKGIVICEVMQIDLPKDYKPITGVVSVGNPYGRLRRAIKRKVRQGKEAKQSNTPYVIVIFNNDIRQPMQNFIVQAAMYGDLCFVINIDHGKPRKESKFRGQAFAADGIIRHARGYKEPGSIFYTRISAVAILDVINPTYHWVSEASEKILSKTKDLRETFGLVSGEIDRLTKEGKYKPTLEVPRLRVFHNFYAKTSLRFDVFEGEYDEQYFIDPKTGESKKYGE